MYKQFLREERGAVIPMIGLMIFVLMVSVGMAIDMTRAQMVQSRLSSALDAAGLAAGSSATTGNLSQEAVKYFNANYPANFMGSNINAPTIETDQDKTVLTLEVNGTVDTIFMRVVGITTMPVSARSRVSRESKGMELVLVLDVTGSMWSGNKYVSLRNATNDLLNTLYGGQSTIENLWVGVVPYVASVNIGSQSQATSWLKSYDLSAFPPTWPPGQTKWKGCVEERAYPLDINDDPPTAGGSATQIASRFDMFFWADNSADNDWYNPSTGNVSLNESMGYSNTDGRGPNISCGGEVLAFTTSRGAVTGHVNSLHPARKGGTMTHVGLVWAWRMLSPRWRGLWDHELVNGQVKLPLDYNTPLMDKVVILETDGDNSFYRTCEYDYNPNRCTWITPTARSDYSSYKRIDTVANGGRSDINTQSISTARDILNSKMSSVCEDMKDAGIIIYTVTFQLGSSASHEAIRSAFRDCATSPDHYFDAESQVSGAEQVSISTAFEQIGDSLANLRITQ